MNDKIEKLIWAIQCIDLIALLGFPNNDDGRSELIKTTIKARKDIEEYL